MFVLHGFIVCWIWVWEKKWLERIWEISKGRSFQIIEFGDEFFICNFWKVVNEGLEFW